MRYSEKAAGRYLRNFDREMRAAEKNSPTGHPAKPERVSRPSKYRNVATTVDGIRFASKAEARRYTELKLLERAGEIISLRRQVAFPIAINGEHVCHYVADFEYQEKCKQF